MPRKKAAKLSRPLKGTWESFAKANGLDSRKPSVELRLTVVVNNNNEEPEQSYRRKFRM